MEDQGFYLRIITVLEGDGAPPWTAARRLMAPFSSEYLGRGFLNQYIVRVSAAIIRAGDEILVVRQLDRGLERINLPGGLAHFNESLREALVREVCEETGFEVIPTEVAFVYEGDSERWPTPTLDVCYAQIDRQTAPPDPTGGQIVGVEWLSLHDPQLLRFISHAAHFTSSKRGQYVDATARNHRGAARERPTRS